ncbi:RNA-dependent RNA polymerase [Beatrice Hill virus]|uniref:Replicase n=1 Tax=Beatrice Hill virus TaxID=1819301 RepID=A0A1J0F5E2_9RHAB|nr:RNA-dependent RNA polymerase [Beatrice Hill virus]APC23645.1 RNA-dependent RNA polymerase [Beatrice Hill virus]
MDPNFEFFEDGGYDYDFSEELGDEGIEDIDSTDYCSLNLINSFDYNLNSPITPEKLNNCILYCQGLPYEKIFYSFDYPKIKTMLANFKMVNVDDLPYYSELVKIWPHLISTIHCPEDGRNFFINAFDNFEFIYNIIRSFYKGWYNKEPPVTHLEVLNSLDRLLDQDLSWFSIFLDLFFIVNLMNAKTVMEQKNICVKKRWKAFKLDGEILYFSGETKTLGTFALSGEFILLVSHNILLDRNTTLMIKDTLVGRFQTILSMICLQSEYKYSDVEIDYLRQLYSLGDKILYTYGSEGYDIIKTLEMICNNWICDESFKYFRPMNDFTSFRNHVNDTINYLVTDGYPLAKNWFNHIMSTTSINLILVFYGSFRHWGHPPIEVLQGLKNLEGLVNEKHKVDDDYCQALASDLAFKVLKKKFKEDKKWYVDYQRMEPNNLLYNHIKNNTWPNPQTRIQFGDNWHKLPLTKCFELPDMIDLSSIYSDKSHSLTRSQVIEHVRYHSDKPIPTKRVLNTLLETENVNWPEFLTSINNFGLPQEDLVIGLKPKEREMKRTGRFFSLMTWNLRNYFVMTELLIKEHFIGLFNGLTMADDLQGLIKKLLDRTTGQGDSKIKKINIANGLDYTKWNNYQRYDSNRYVFKVMGQFLGYEKLIERTHQFFEQSLIYYPQRPDLMIVQNNTLENRGSDIVCWNGQLGGLEGLRQKGWSVLNYLMIERESKVRNSQIKILAQGDNQIIFTSCFLDPYYSDDELLDNMNRAKDNNDAIMNAVMKGAEKIGLVINMDETIQSCCYANYGKVIIFRSKILGLATKRWSRVTCSSNDQIPSLGTLLASVSTNAMTVGNFSETPHDAILGHLIFGLIVLEVLAQHNPAIRGDPSKYIVQHRLMEHPLFKIILLYLDPSLGGIGGTSLNRFLIRAFADPVTESLSFWKLIYENCDNNIIKNLCLEVGNPSLATYSDDHFLKLVEKPESLNIPKGISSTNMIKEQIKISLINNAHNIKNRIIHDVTVRIQEEEPALIAWLKSIKPVFPRFLSEMASSTFYGLSNNLISLFTNSRTIRNCFKTKCLKEVDYLIIKSEVIGIVSCLKLIIKTHTNKYDSIWTCSASQADKLRKLSWNEDIIGMTVPHPIEMHKIGYVINGECSHCYRNELSQCYISILTPRGIPVTNYYCEGGPYKPYLGSSTNEGTSVLQPWEKETKIPIIKRAARLRDVISWFVGEDSNLSESIINNLESLTGENWGNYMRGFKRTGSALHRFRCARISNGGFSACSPTKSSWMIITTDTMTGLDEANYDFMFQASIVFSQVTVGSLHGSNSQVYHMHLNCQKCLREIQEPILESDWILKPKPVYELLKQWRPDPDLPWGFNNQICEIQNHSTEWDLETNTSKCYFVGLILGFLFGDKVLSNTAQSDNNLFPLSIRTRLDPSYFYGGLLRGFKLISAVHLTHRRNVISGQESRSMLYGTLYYLIEEVSCDTDFIQFVSTGNLHSELFYSPHKIPPSYPLSGKDLGSLARSYLKYQLKDSNINSELKYVWVFADIRSPKLLCTLGISLHVEKLLFKESLTKKDKELIKRYQEDYILGNNNDLPSETLNFYISGLRFCESEVRHSCKFSLPKLDYSINQFSSSWGPECRGYVNEVDIICVANEISCNHIDVVQHRNPIISGLRLFQCATGAHYKIRSILQNYSVIYHDALIGGDGSGGISALCLRYNIRSKVIFNSLLQLEDSILSGSRPTGPSAVASMGDMKFRCVNFDTVWQEPSDLREIQTWRYFMRLKNEFNLKIDLAVFDMEVTDVDSIKKIDNLLISHLYEIFTTNQNTLIYKTYLDRLLNYPEMLLKLCQHFKSVKAVTTEFSSFKTSEIYLLCQNLEAYPVTSRTSISLDTRQQLINLAYANVPLTKEINRALNIYKRKDLMNGIPIHLVSDPFLDLSTLFVMSGSLTSDACAILQTNTRSNLLNILVSELCKLTNIIFELTVIHPRKIKVPSSPNMNNYFALVIGIGTWLALTLGDQDYIRLMDAIINKHVYEEIYFYALANNKGIINQWRISENHTNKLICKKRFHVSHKLATIGQVIRSCELSYRTISNPNPLSSQEINELMLQKNKKLKLKYVLKSCDLFFYLPDAVLS